MLKSWVSEKRSRDFGIRFVRRVFTSGRGSLLQPTATNGAPKNTWSLAPRRPVPIKAGGCTGPPLDVRFLLHLGRVNGVVVRVVDIRSSRAIGFAIAILVIVDVCVLGTDGLVLVFVLRALARAAPFKLHLYACAAGFNLRRRCA